MPRRKKLVPEKPVYVSNLGALLRRSLLCNVRDCQRVDSGMQPSMDDIVVLLKKLMDPEYLQMHRGVGPLKSSIIFLTCMFWTSLFSILISRAIIMYMFSLPGTFLCHHLQHPITSTVNGKKKYQFQHGICVSHSCILHRSAWNLSYHSEDRGLSRYLPLQQSPSRTLCRRSTSTIGRKSKHTISPFEGEQK